MRVAAEQYRIPGIYRTDRGDGMDRKDRTAGSEGCDWKRQDGWKRQDTRKLVRRWTGQEERQIMEDNKQVKKNKR